MIEDIQQKVWKRLKNITNQRYPFDEFWVGNTFLITLSEVEKASNKILNNRRKIANEQIKDEQSMTHTHTAINHIEKEIKKEIGI